MTSSLQAAFDESSCADVSRRRTTAAGRRGSGGARILPPSDEKERRLDATTMVDVVVPLTVAKSYETEDCSIMCYVIGVMQAQARPGVHAPPRPL